jgi:hypothetical protein
VNKTFRWVAAAKRPLLLEELREAIAIEPDDKFLERDRLVNRIDGLTSWCGDLVTLDEEDLLVQFAHNSVKEFLVSEQYSAATEGFHFRLTDVDHAAGEACVAYLNFNDFKRQMIKPPKAYQSIQPRDLITDTIMGSHNRLAKYGFKLAKTLQKDSKADFDVIKQLDHTRAKSGLSPLERLQTQYSFLLYARDHWLLHTTNFTKNNTRLWNVWKQLVFTEHPLALKPWTIGEDGITRGPVQEYILEKNHCAILACFRESGNQVQKRINEGDLLIQASGRGMVGIVICILDYDKYTTFDASRALQTAAGGGHLEVVERLLTANANVNAAASTWDGRTALEAAAEGGHLEVVERLLTANANVNSAASMWDGRTALQAAAGGGHLEVVERLLAANANVNAHPSANNGRTALQAAAEGGHIKVVEILKSAGAEY